jgi:CubicO group peptidase (beta-lactamase class C family)
MSATERDKLEHVRYLGFVLCMAALAAVADAPPELPRAAPESMGLSGARLAELRPWMEERIASGRVPGMVTMVARQGKVVHLASAGTLDLETGARVADDSLFRIYSMTKPITTAGLMALYDEGLFELDDPVAEYIPELGNLEVWTEQGNVPLQRPVTIADLLRHTSGLTYGFFGDTPVDQLYREHNVFGQRDLKAMVGVLSDLPLLHQPGTRWHYGVSTDVIGHLIERISGRPLDRFLEERIFRPLGMDDTAFVVPESKLARFGTNHAFDAGSQKLTVVESPRAGEAMPKPGFVGDVTLFQGGGGLVSTAADYMRFCLMLTGDGAFDGTQILKAETVDLMREDQLPEGIPGVFGGDMRFGYGFAIVGDQGGRRAVGSAGSYWWFGVAGTQFWIDPVEDLVGIMLIQVRGNREPLINEFAERVYAALD